MLVCFGCRELNPHANSYTRLDTEFRLYVDYAVHNCGGVIQLAPRHWCPPKKNNDRAWKRVASGDWLWDHRRVRRVSRRQRWGRSPIERIVMPGHKKGQYPTLTGGDIGTTADLGG